jgi:hypothetical protein
MTTWLQGFAGALPAAALAVGLALGGGASAATIDFEAAAPGSDVAGLGAPGASLSGGLALDEAFATALLGFPATGTWNTTPGGSKGALNTLAAEIAIDFAIAVRSLSVDVLALPDLAGAPGSVLLLAFGGADLIGFDLSDPGAIGDSGLPEDTLSVAGLGITRALICAPGQSGLVSCLAPGVPTTVWIDQLRFEPIPEPGTLTLTGLALAAFAASRRTR